MASSAARIGPTTRVPLIIAELRLIAPGRSWRCTSSGIDDWKAGALSALAMPIPSCAANSVHSAVSANTNQASATVRTTDADCIVSCSFCLDTRSARTPPGIERISSGPSCMNTMRPTSAGRPVRTSMYAGSVKFCIHVPMFDSARPMKMMRNPRYENAARAVPGVWPWSGATSISAGAVMGVRRASEGLDPWVKLPPGAGLQRNWRKQARRSSTNRSGTSNAAKWPPRGCSLQCRMSVKESSTHARTGGTISLG